MKAAKHDDTTLAITAMPSANCDNVFQTESSPGLTFDRNAPAKTQGVVTTTT
eukprot:CAMPEP_0172885046 /NCGR_PEP_ID=MMETSP1075-20121228/126886_1 /TAXON_ID=2916 /ORGANISM="Ceratium fusus, Strain PA161109" /LENGTH=51 /DNA_ID=CAMNT_0013738249 /DNA_START=25 /DNA_END=176 /DNA_ORIENTATION=+